MVVEVGHAPFAQPLIMGVLNVTPNSFSDGGSFLSADAAIEHGLKMIAAGANVIDVGGESTKPGAEPTPQGEELRRVLPVIEALVAAGATVSIDTIHAATARAAVAAGATIINDVSGGLHDPAIREVAAETGATYIAVHWRGVPDPQQRRSDYADVVTEVRDDLARLADAAIAAGVSPERIVLDPGLGFDKTAAQGWQLLAGLPVLAELGYPLFIGISRKRMLAETLRSASVTNLDAKIDVPMGDRDVATSTVSALAAMAGVWGVRVHDVPKTVAALAVAEAWGNAAELPVEHATMTSEIQDRVTLTGLEVFAHHGVFDFEREQGQRFLIDVDLAVDLRAAASDDALGETVHYGDLADAIVAAVGRDPVDLIETVAERVASVALSFGGVVEARVTVHKPDAPIEAPFADVSVTVVRSRGTAAASALGAT